ncbi:hypothetical protein AAG570_004641 [Ranatra chinensis]|uniref:VWFD domain-containing protein n=1 Tax=Ranatra chinensis TaxID=642074 RepID=A0ABD0Y2V7_9HEMI
MFYQNKKQETTEFATLFGESLRLIIEQFVLVIEELSHFWASVDIMITDTIEKVNVIVQDVAPRLRTSITNIMQVLRDLYTEWSHFASQLVNLGLKELKRIEDELKIIIDSYAEYFRGKPSGLQRMHTFHVCNLLVEFYSELVPVVTTDLTFDLGKGVLNLVAVAEKELTNIIHNLIDFFNDLPVMEFINQRISELAGFESPEEVLWTITQVLEQLKSMAPSDGVAHLIEVLSGYVEKIMKKEEFDLDEAAENIFKALVAAIESLAKFLEENGISNDIDVWDTMQSYVKSSPTSALMAPKGSLRLSILEWLISADLPEVEDLIATYFPFNILKPFSYFPPYAAMGTILGNGDVITFDGVHLSLGHTGERAYILAKDITDGNFTLVAGFGANGKLNSVELSDGKDNIEIRHEKTALVNGKESEYLVSQGSMNAWRTPSECGIFSRAGVLVKCDSDFRWCLVTIDGFYHNRLRGILGNPNYEPFDDTATSLAKIAGNTGEFAKSWRLTEGEETPHPAHEHERQQLCTDFFSGEDSNFAFDHSCTRRGCTRELYCDYPESIKAEDGVQGAKHVLPGQEAGDDGNMVCFYSEPVGPWRAACDHALHKAKDEEQKRVAACGVAAAYAHACRSRGNPLSLLPDECVVCKVGDKRLKKEETQVVTLPGKSADVLFVVELDKEVEGLYQNLLGPLVNSLQSDFKEQGINDVHFGLAGYGGVAKEYTVYYTTGGKIKFNGKSEAIKFTPHGPMPNVTLIDKLKVLWNMINEEIGNTDRLRAYNDVMLEYNFRPEAVKVIVGLNAHPCETGEDLISLATLRTLLGFGLYKAMGVHINYIYPFKVAIDDDKSKTVVGFNQDRVFTLENSHSRPIAGLPNKVDDLEYDTDVCVFFNKLDVQSQKGGKLHVPISVVSWSNMRSPTVAQVEDGVQGPKHINGNVLAGGNFKTTSDKPKFISIASQMIVHSATKDLTTVECTCQTSLDLLRSRPICTVDDVAERKPKKAAFTKGLRDIQSQKDGKLDVPISISCFLFWWNMFRRFDAVFSLSDCG